MAITISYPKAQAAAPAPKVERATVKVRKAKVPAVRKTEPKSSKPLTNSEHQAKWREAHPDAARRQAAERMKGLRARLKTGKAVGS